MPVRSDDDIARTRAFWASSKPSDVVVPAFVPDPPTWWHVGVALLAALVLQSTFAPALAFRGATVSFVTLLVVWYGLRTGWAYGLLFGTIAGSCDDALAGSTGVAWTFATGLCGAIAGCAARTPLAETRWTLVGGVAALTLLRYGAFAIGMQMQNRPLALPETHLHAALWQSVLHALVAVVVLRFGPEIGGRFAYRR